MSNKNHFTWQAAVFSSDLPANTKLVLIAVGARMNQFGQGAWPSYNTIAADTSLSRRTVIDAIKLAVERGFITKKTRHKAAKSGDGFVVTNDTNEYEISWVGGAGDAPGVVQGLHQGGEQAAPGVVQGLHPNTPLEHSQEHKRESTRKTRASSPAVCLKTWLAELPEDEAAIRADDPIFADSKKTGLPEDFIALCWDEFKHRHTQGGNKAKKYKDWRAAFRNAVRDNWYGFWALSSDGECFLTSKGRFAQRFHSAEKAA